MGKQQKISLAGVCETDVLERLIELPSGELTDIDGLTQFALTEIALLKAAQGGCLEAKKYLDARLGINPGVYNDCLFKTGVEAEEEEGYEEEI